VPYDDSIRRRRLGLPRWLKLAYTAYMLILVPAYWQHYGPGNFLWFCDVALFLGLAALWLEEPLLASMAAISILVPELVWTADLVASLLGRRLIGMTDYMFDPAIPPLVRGLTLFHLWLPVVLIAILARLGYDRRALRLQLALGTVVMMAAFVLTGPEVNINRVHQIGRFTGVRALGLALVIVPLLSYLPAHLLLRACLPKPVVPSKID
jgi:hypothetical protein